MKTEMLPIGRDLVSHGITVLTSRYVFSKDSPAISLLFTFSTLIKNYYFYRWKLVIHGGIDGYTRIPVYLKCSTNNRADTVLQYFKEAVNRYGLPSRVRSDRGGENVEVSLFMLQHPLRGPGRG